MILPEEPDSGLAEMPAWKRPGAAWRRPDERDPRDRRPGPRRSDEDDAAPFQQSKQERKPRSAESAGFPANGLQCKCRRRRAGPMPLALARAACRRAIQKRCRWSRSAQAFRSVDAARDVKCFDWLSQASTGRRAEKPRVEGFVAEILAEPAMRHPRRRPGDIVRSTCGCPRSGAHGQDHLIYGHSHRPSLSSSGDHE